jgi:putative ubiquitin-RnfH superfamily antitoxin RatB of RatAB toxin-antitoxin module
MVEAAKLTVEVCYASPAAQFLRRLQVPAGSTLHQAISLSGVLEEIPEIDLSVLKVGIHNRLQTLDTVLRDGDRVEIYRPLLADPKDARRRRAGKKPR